MRMVDSDRRKQVFGLSLFLTPDEAREMIESLEELIDLHENPGDGERLGHAHVFDEYMSGHSIPEMLDHYSKFRPNDTPDLELVDTERATFIKGIPKMRQCEIMVSVYDYETTSEWGEGTQRILEDVYGRIDDVGEY